MTTSDMSSALNLIRTRRNVRSFSARPVDDSQIRDIIEAATWAPNHRMTEPWRFYVLRKDGPARSKVAELTYEWVLENTPNKRQALPSAEAARDELVASPALIYAYSLDGETAEVAEENYAATACAIQNLMLAAHAGGLGVGWSTGKPTKHPGIRDVLGVEQHARVAGCLYIGFPDIAPTAERQGVDSVTAWL